MNGLKKLIAVAALAIGVGGGSYGIASAASSNSGATPAAAAAAAPSAANPWGSQRSDETLLIGTAESSVRAAAQGRVPGGTIARIETDADGHAAYEAQMTKADGTPVTVYVDKSFRVVSVESR